MSSAVQRMSLLRSARWVFDCSAWRPTESEWLRAATGVQEDEKTRIGQFVFKRDAKHSMVGRLLIRKYIVGATGMSWQSVRIARDVNNKPVFRGDVSRRVEFNVSHQGSYAVLAGECDTRVQKLGVDVMKIEYTGGKSVTEFFRIMNRQFSEDEWSVIKSQPSEREQLMYFYRFWCLKESYVKATGTGITVNLQQISFKLNSPTSIGARFVCDTQLFLYGVKQDDWTFQEFMLDKDHCCAVALNLVPLSADCETEDVSVVDEREGNFKRLSLDELMQDLAPITEPDITYCRSFLVKEEEPF